MTTAGHCPNAQDSRGVSLPFVNEVVGGQHDEQLHLPAAFVVRNWVFDNNVGHTRAITSRTGWGGQGVGQTVCKYGKTTQFTCGEIFTRFYDPETCLTGSQDPFFVQVHRAGVNLSERGDSGGPWYRANSAYGTHSCGLGNDAIYTASDFVEIGLAVTIMTAP